jgi:hypothetical protein
MLANQAESGRRTHLLPLYATHICPSLMASAGSLRMDEGRRMGVQPVGPSGVRKVDQPLAAAVCAVGLTALRVCERRPVCRDHGLSPPRRQSAGVRCQ